MENSASATSISRQREMGQDSVSEGHGNSELHLFGGALGEFMNCQNCGNEDIAGHFCNNCGAAIIKPEKVTPTTSETSSSSSQAWAVVLLIMVLAITVAFLYVQFEKEKGPAGSASNSETNNSVTSDSPAVEIAPTTLTFDPSNVFGNCYFRDGFDSKHAVYCEASVLVMNETDQALPLGDYGGFDMFPSEYAAGSLACDGLGCPAMLEPNTSITVTVRNGHIYQSAAKITGFWLADSATQVYTMNVPWDYTFAY